MDAVAFSAGQFADLLLLVGSAEIESRDVGPRVDLPAAHLQRFQAAGDLLEHAAFRFQRVAVLIDVAQFDGRPDPQLAGVGLLLADEHAEQRRLAGPVGPDHAHDPAGGQIEAEVFDQHAVAEALGQLLGLDHQVAQVLARRNLDFEFVQLFFEVLGRHLLVSLDTGLALGLPSARGHADPLQLALQRFLPREAGFLLLRQTLLLLLQPGRVVAFPRDAAAAIQFEDPAGDVIQEVPIVRHGHDRARILRQVPFQPRHGLGVQMVGGLVQQQQIGPLQQQLAQRHAPPLAAGQAC